MLFRAQNNTREEKSKIFKSQVIITKDDFEEVVKKLVDNNPNLEEIYIVRDSFDTINGIQVKDIEYQLSYEDLEKFSNALKKNHTLKKLVINNQPIKDIGVEALTQALLFNDKIPLEHLDLRGNKISWVGARFLAEILLKKDSSLKHLNLSFNQIGNTGTARLAKVLEENSTLQSLLLSRNQITDKSVLLLAKALEINTALKTLFLFTNQISDLGAAQLLESIKVNKTLTELALLFQFREKNVLNEISASLLDEINTQTKFNESYSSLKIR